MSSTALIQISYFPGEYLNLEDIEYREMWLSVFSNAIVCLHTSSLISFTETQILWSVLDLNLGLEEPVLRTEFSLPPQAGILTSFPQTGYSHPLKNLGSFREDIFAQPGL